MRTRIAILARGAVCLMLGVALSAGCAGDDGTAEETEATTPVASTEEVGATQESLTSVDMVDCSICATARACCTAVSTSSYCNNFNAERCATLDPGRMRTTKINCLMLLRTTISAWRLNGSTPPSECRIPGE